MIRVLVVDDSAVVRKALARRFAHDPEIEVVGAAPDPYVARDLIARTHPHVLTLDIDMPRMDGLTFLAKLMGHCPLPVIIVSSLTPRGSRMALPALELGAIDVISKPESAYAVGDLGAQLTRTIKAAALIDVRKLVPAALAAPAAPPAALALLGAGTHRIVAIGGSTGGTRAIAEIITRFPANGPATLIVQHMPPGFTRAFAQRLDQLSAMTVREASAGDAIERGVVLIAPGDHHMTIGRTAGRTIVMLRDGPRVNFQRPPAWKCSSTRSPRRSARMRSGSCSRAWATTAHRGCCACGAPARARSRRTRRPRSSSGCRERRSSAEPPSRCSGCRRLRTWRSS